MKATELRIGSWVRYKDGQDVQIEPNDFGEIEAIKDWCDIYIKPIPLTEERLEKFEFIFDENKFELGRQKLLEMSDVVHKAIRG